MTITDVDLMEVQQGLEDESRALGRTRYRNNRNAPWTDLFGPQVDEASLPPGRMLLRRAHRATAEAIRGFMETAGTGKAGRRHTAYTLLSEAQAEPEALAFLTLKCAINAGVQELRAQKASRMVARAVMGHLESAAFVKSNPEGAEGLQKSLAGRSVISARRQRLTQAILEKEGVTLHWSEAEQVNVGMKLIELAIDATGLFEMQLITTRSGSSHKSEQRFQVTDKVGEWLDRQHERCELLDPVPMPMVVPPCPWTTTTDGGYLDPPYGSSLVNSHCAPYREEIRHMDLEPVFRAVNAVQETAWRINRRLFEVLDRLTAEGGALAGLAPRDPEPMPARPEGLSDEDEAVATWKSRCSEIHAHNAASTSKRRTTAHTLWIARKFLDFPAIYFPHDLDWRGRFYPIPHGGPNPQASDVGRSLLEFAKGKPVGSAGARWLAIHLANTFGIDKVGFDERLAWVERHRAEIVDSAKDPLDGARFWTTADKPWAALAACFGWADYLEQGEAFVSHLPIAIDGSNSGLQHYTGLLRDAKAAPHVNLVAAEKPGDIYMLVAAKAQALADASADPKAAPWKNGRITRGVVKRPCMTYVYGVARFGMADQIRAELADLDEKAAAKGQRPHLSGADNFEAANWLAGQLYRIIGETVPAAKAAMDWLKKAAEAISDIDLPLWWTTPVGLPVMQRYPNTKARKVEVTVRGRRMQLQLDQEAGPQTPAEWLERRDVPVLDRKEALKGIAPNFIHSLDAAHLMLTVQAANEAGIADIAVIHDSFGTHAADTDRLSVILRETFVSMYEGNLLAQFKAELLEQLQANEMVISALPPLPSQGDLDLKAVLSAAYMFA